MSDIKASNLDGITKGNTASRPASGNSGDLYVNTQTGFLEIYDTTYGWEQVGGPASVVTGVTATDSGSGRAYNNGRASVAFTPGTIAGRTYTVTSSPGGFTATGSSSPVTVTGLQSSTQYTYTVTATNNYGTSTASAASAGVTATTVPQSPTIGTATAGNTSATLTFTTGATGGSTITNYKWSTDGSTYTAFSPPQTTSPLSFTGLTNGNSYAWYLKAVNENGDSIASAISNSITPLLPGSFESIQTIDASGSSTVTFSSIPQTYKHLQIRGIAKNSEYYSATSYLMMRINDDVANNYRQIGMYGSSAGTVSVNGTSGTAYSSYTFNIGVPRSDGSANFMYAPFVLDIADYTATTHYKTIISTGGSALANGNAYFSNDMGVWQNNSAITSITILVPNNSHASGTMFYLYGSKG